MSNAEDFTAVASLAERKFPWEVRQRKEVANANASRIIIIIKQEKKNHQNDTVRTATITTITTTFSKEKFVVEANDFLDEPVPSLGLGKAYPTRVIVNMAQCTKEKSFSKDELSGVEFYPRTKDGSNATACTCLVSATT